mgnify:CR=1 FL=1
MKRLVPLLPVLALLVLHTDVWLWNDATMLWGLPIGLSYHVGFCVAAMAALAILVRYRWPRELVEAAYEGAATAAAEPAGEDDGRSAPGKG